MQTVQKQLAVCGFLAVGTVASAAAVAATQWEASAYATPSLTYSDNICLTNDDKEDGWIAGFTPGGTITGKSRKSSLNLNGSVNLNSLTNSALKDKGCRGDFNDRNQYNPQFSGNFNTVLSPNFMRLAVRARAGQNEVSTRFRGSNDEFNRTGNANTFYRYSITPTITHRFSGIVAMNLNYSYDEVINTNDFLVNSRKNAAVVTFKNARPSPWSRSLTARTSVLQYDEDFRGNTRQDSEFTSVRLGLGYRFGSKFSINGEIGEEWNNFQTFFPRDEDGNAWQFTVRWAPTPRTAISIGQGDRFFGKTPRVNISHSRKRSQFTASYRRQLTFRRDLTTDDLEGFPFDLENIGNPAIWSETPIVDERLTVGWAYRGRGTFSLTGNYSEQSRTEDGESAIYTDVRLSYDPRLIGPINLNGSIGWREDEPRGILFDFDEIIDDNSTTQTLYFDLRASRPISDRMSLSVSYRYTDRSGGSDITEYQENRIRADLSVRF